MFKGGGMEKFFLDNEEYLLTSSEAKEVDEANDKFPVGPEGDVAFNDWFRAFLERKRIKPVNRRMARWWTGASNSTEDSVKLALTLKSQRAVLQVMDSENALTVNYSQQDEAAWDGAGNVVIPSRPARDAKDLYEAINITSGFTVHEAAHSKNTRQIDSTRLRGYMKTNPLNAILVDLLEDDRIEVIEMQENPGFQGYLDNRDEYIWNTYDVKSLLGNLPKDYKEADYKQKLAAASTILAPTWEERARSVLDPSYYPLLDAVKEHLDKYSSYLKGMTDAKAIEMTEELKSILEITPEDEQKSKEEKEELKEQQGKMQPCSGEPTNDRLDDAIAQEIQDLVEQEVERLDPTAPMFIPDGNTIPKITVFKPKVTNKEAMPRADGLLAKAKAAFEFRKAAPRADERMMLSGEVDEDEVYRLLSGDMRVFRDISEEVLPSAAVYFLVDLSGSMSQMFDDRSYNHGDRIAVAQKMAYLFLQALHTRPNVKTKVLGHTGDVVSWTDIGRWTRLDGAQFYRIWEEGDPINRISLISTLDHGNNYDSYAIAWAGKMLAEEDAEQKLLIVLSDGQPAGDRYGGYAAMEHVKKHVDALERKGITTINISMYSGLSDTTQARMYKHYVPAKGGSDAYADLITKFQRLLLKVGRRG